MMRFKKRKKKKKETVLFPFYMYSRKRKQLAASEKIVGSDIQTTGAVMWDYRHEKKKKKFCRYP